MQHSPYEIKDKLLQALDHEYNVVDMAAVLEVIAALEKACITKEALEKTRIGRYINELRKRTTGEQLARRAKELVKSWRKLLPQTTQRVNGEEILNTISLSPASVTLLGPGPGPGFGPGPGPGNRILKSVSVPGTPRYKASSPSIMGERSSSPYFSSASNSPLLNSVHQGTSLPSNYAPVKFLQCRGEKNNCVNKNMLNVSNQSKNGTSSQTFKPISPSLATLKQAVNTLSSGSPSQRTWSPNVSPGLRTNSSSSSTSLSVNMCSQNVSPTLSHSLAHSTLDIAKTNAANKRLRKEISNNRCSSPKEQINCNNTKIENGVSELSESILPSETSAFKKLNLFKSKCNNDENDELILVTSLKTPKRKRSFDKNELHDNRLGDMIASLPSGSKLPKVKTTQQLIADLQAKKGTNVSPDSFSPIDSLQLSSPIDSEAEVSRTKSELLKKFLIAQSLRQESNQSPTDESSVSIPSDYGSHFVSDVSSVINKDSSHPDPVDEEINRILSALPPINPAEINLEEEDPLPNRSSSVTSDDLNRLAQPWEYVNGMYDWKGTWRPWQECCEQRSLGESFLLLPYVNID